MADQDTNAAPEETPEKTKTKNTKPKPPPSLTRNPISYLGWLICIAMLAMITVLITADFLFYKSRAYKDIITYMILPSILGGGVFIIFAGALLEWRRRHRHDPKAYPRLPIMDMNQGFQRRRAAVAAFMISLLFGASAILVYHSYHFTESPMFCGETCHMVMKPEYTAYKYSPHSRVACTECHIGPGAEWFVKAKLSGLKQVWQVATNSFELPIGAPVENLRPAQDTCEQCHWPEKFFSSIEKVSWHFSPDQANTPARYNLLLKVGGGDPSLGMGRGIHWHSSSDVKVRYWPRDKRRLDIPWIEVTEGGDPPLIYKSKDCPDPPEAEIRNMDCIDCHNRPSHIYRSPRQIIDGALSTGALEGTLPYLKRHATDLFEAAYESEEEALNAIAGKLRGEYAKRMTGPRGKELVENNIARLQDLYTRSFFPDFGVDWRDYPNHLGHFEFPGCTRCHDGRHTADDPDTPGAKITLENDCGLCHDMVSQARGEAVFGEAHYERMPFQHPRNLGVIWEGHDCHECHGRKSPTPARLDAWGQPVDKDADDAPPAGDPPNAETPTR